MKFPEWIMFGALVVATGTALARGPRDDDDAPRPATQATAAYERGDALRDDSVERQPESRNGTRNAR